jgi:hypothetical protein
MHKDLPPKHLPYGCCKFYLYVCCHVLYLGLKMIGSWDEKPLCRPLSGLEPSQ